MLEMNLGGNSNVRAKKLPTNGLFPTLRWPDLDGIYFSAQFAKDQHV